MYAYMYMYVVLYVVFIQLLYMLEAYIITDV